MGLSCTNMHIIWWPRFDLTVPQPTKIWLGSSWMGPVKIWFNIPGLSSLVTRGNNWYDVQLSNLDSVLRVSWAPRVLWYGFNLVRGLMLWQEERAQLCSAGWNCKKFMMMKLYNWGMVDHILWDNVLQYSVLFSAQFETFWWVARKRCFYTISRISHGAEFWPVITRDNLCNLGHGCKEPSNCMHVLILKSQARPAGMWIQGNPATSDP